MASKKKSAELVETGLKKADEMIEAVEKVIEEKQPEIEKAAKEITEKAVKTTKKAAEKAKKTVQKFEPKKTTVVFEADGRSFNYDDIVKTVNKACKGKTAKKLEIYVNAYEGAAYYVLDGEGSEEYRVEL